MAQCADCGCRSLVVEVVGEEVHYFSASGNITDIERTVASTGGYRCAECDSTDIERE